MGFDDYNKGQMGRGGTQWGNEDWEAGNRRRQQEEQVKQAENYNSAQREREAREQQQRAQIARSNEAFSNSLRANQSAVSYSAPAQQYYPSSSPSFSAPVQRVHVSSAGGYSERASSRFIRFATAPFRWMRALLRFLWKSTVWLVKAALVLVLVVGALIVLSGLDKQGPNTPGLPRIGVDVVDLTPEGAAQVGMNPQLQGVLVNRVIENGPAFRADLLPGDVIVRVNGKPVGSAKELVSRVRKQRVGWSIPVQYFRRGELQTAMITPTGFR